MCADDRKNKRFFAGCSFLHKCFHEQYHDALTERDYSVVSALKRNKYKPQFFHLKLPAYNVMRCFIACYHHVKWMYSKGAKAVSKISHRIPFNVPHFNSLGLQRYARSFLFLTSVQCTIMYMWEWGGSFPVYEYNNDESWWFYRRSELSHYSAEMNFLCFLISLSSLTLFLLLSSVLLKQYIQVPWCCLRLLSFTSNSPSSLSLSPMLRFVLMKKHFIWDYCKSLFDDVFFSLRAICFLYFSLLFFCFTKYFFLFYGWWWNYFHRYKYYSVCLDLISYFYINNEKVLKNYDYGFYYCLTFNYFGIVLIKLYHY